jgi:hypothetical protein
MNPRFEDEERSRRGARQIPVEDGKEFNEQDPHLHTADVASVGERTLRAPAEAAVQTEARRPVPGAAERAEETTPLFSADETDDFKSRWDSVQVKFVDEPRRAVEQADSLVAAAIQRLAQVFAEEKSKLEGQFKRGDNVSTEDLRVALQHYRTFFARLLSI